MTHRLVGLAAAVVAIALALTASAPLDYGNPSCRLARHCDDAEPAITALSRARVADFFRQQRLMGPVSQVAQAPAVAVAGGGVLSRYRAGLLVCLLLLAGFGFVLARRAAAAGWSLPVQLLVAVGTVWNPVTHWIIAFGHQEEIVAALLAIAALELARRGRSGWSGLLLGLAVATKLWVLMAVPLVLVVALPRVRRCAAVALLSAGSVYAACALAAPATFSANVHELGRLGSAAGTASRTDVWFGLVRPGLLAVPVGTNADGGVRSVIQPVFSAPRVIGPLSRVLLLAIALTVALALLRRAARHGPAIWLALALILLLRCILDPGNRSYYHLPFLLALLVYEVEARKRGPILAVSAAALFEGFTRLSPHLHGDHALGVAYCAWSIPLATVIAVELWQVVSGRWISTGRASSDAISLRSGADTTQTRSTATSG